jgi:Phage integrase, N-terminal SAM-like domain
MAYDWRPTGSPTATTTAPRVVVQPGRPPERAPPENVLTSTVVDEFLEAAAEGRARNRSGRPYRPSALRDVRGILRHHVAHELGHMQLREVRRRHLQELVDRLAAERLSESRIRSVVSAVRALYGYAIERGYVELSPATGLVIPRPAPAAAEDETDWRWADDLDDGPPSARSGSARTDRDRGDYEPIALLTERILSLVLRIVVVIFIVFALVTIAGSA